MTHFKIFHTLDRSGDAELGRNCTYTWHTYVRMGATLLGFRGNLNEPEAGGSCLSRPRDLGFLGVVLDRTG